MLKKLSKPRVDILEIYCPSPRPAPLGCTKCKKVMKSINLAQSVRQSEVYKGRWEVGLVKLCSPKKKP